MNTVSLFENELEEKLHITTIWKLAEDMGIPINEVDRIYHMVLKRASRTAKIKYFLPVLVSRRVRYLLENRRR